MFGPIVSSNRNCPMKAHVNQFFVLIRCFSIVLLIGTCSEERPMMSQCVPTEVHGWRIGEEVRTYTRETIFDYIDGAGEVYRQYDFQELTVYRFNKADEPEIVLELFDMGSSGDAFGVFTHGREGDEVGIGQGSEQKGSFLCFWKGQYFVCVYAEGESQSTQEAVTTLGTSVAEAMDDIGPKPKILDSLPKEGLNEKGLRFFHTHASLNYHYFVASDNILKLDEHTDAVLATYGDEESKSLLLLIGYPDATKARTAFDSFVDAYMPEARETHILQTEDGTWVAAMVRENVVVVVFEALRAEIAEELIRAVEVTD